MIDPDICSLSSLTLVSKILDTYVSLICAGEPRSLTELTSYSTPCYIISQSSGLLQVQKELGLQIHPWQESIIDMATTLIQRGIAKPVPK